MTSYFAFNGDADGLCALQQLRLSKPGDATLVTGVKRDIHLLERVPATVGDCVYALDISMAANHDALVALLGAGAQVHYFDHHLAGDIPDHPSLHSHINLAPNVCTSILVSEHLRDRYRLWAITAAFGDGLPHIGASMATEAGLSEATTRTLASLGVSLNYNAYGETVHDLHFHPAELAEAMAPFEDPRDFAEHSDACARLFAGYEDDMGRARSLSPLRACDGATILLLPAEPWARRAIGVLANELVQANPGNAFALLSPNSTGDFTVSVRVPETRETGAGDFCQRFETGGGRRLAGGINRLAENDIDKFAEQFETHYRVGA
ncbi:acetyltransferase [Pandoraea vervacti]|uniref:Acetyltransferase n=1 Tax=Pandoraea vervacti TaxID=656178 RepID=A0ABM5SWH1_9BURK|nr:hypothetical protein [Pandoraea vervacti]AJP56820.1 acetyltransferase [Pandoraea vervacti]